MYPAKESKVTCCCTHRILHFWRSSESHHAAVGKILVKAFLPLVVFEKVLEISGNSDFVSPNKGRSS